MIYGQCFLIDFLSGWSVHWWKWDVKIPYYHCITVNFSRCLISTVCRCSYIGCICTYNCCIFSLDSSFYHYEMSLCISCCSLCFIIYFVRYKYCYWLSFHFHLLGIPFPTSHFYSVHVFRYEMSLFMATYIQVLFFNNFKNVKNSFSHPLSFICSMQSINT